MTNNIPDSTKKRVVIVGGGFAGITLANQLNNKLFQVVLIDKNNYHQFQPLLYQVASSGLEAGSICFPFRKIFRKKRDFFFRLAEAVSIDTQHKTLSTTIGTISYDYLVLGLGTRTNYFGNQNIETNALPMKTLEDAILLRNRILLNLEQTIITSQGSVRECLQNIVIVGGGATGVEVAGVLSEMKRYVVPHDFPELKDLHLNIYLVEGSDRLLGGMSEHASTEALKALRHMGIEVRLNTKVVDYKDELVCFDNGDSLASKTLVWVSGVTANRLEGITDDKIGRGGRIITDEYLRMNGTDDIFIIGDMALIQTPQNKTGHPQVAQVAIQQGQCTAKNLESTVLSQPLHPFKYKDKGSMATIGRNKAVADIGKIKLHGLSAWIIWMVIHLRSILGIKNKLIILLDWIWNYISYNRSIRLLILRGKRE